ncbi:polysaccharide deacetylase family protein [Knoellia sp. CPCC 206453]|uniref:polysaccharide deacetylase family protein n=1 Tax=Knoellia pratensis TaxID=3404796 RepID=UPI003621C7D0
MSITTSTRPSSFRRPASVAMLTLALVTMPTVASPGMAPSAHAAVWSCSSTTPVASRPQLRRGDTGSCVTVLQRALIAKGYSVGGSGADGSFGSATDLAVRRFQSDYVGVKVDGVVGQQTWGTLVNGGTRYSRSAGPNRTSRVVLSFDDCPSSYSTFQGAVLGAERIGVALVLFPTGNCITSGKFSASYARAHGHYVFNHSVSHPDLTTLSYANVRSQLSAPGVVTTYGRPPYGAYNNTVLNAYASKGIRVWTWTVDTRDWTGKTQSSVVSYAVSNSRAGSTVLMHMQWRAFNATAISQMKSGLASRGLAVCANRGPTAVSPSSVAC